VIARALLTIGVLCSSAGAAAQPAHVYLQLLQRYQQQPEEAARIVAKLPGREISNGLRLCRSGSCSLPLLRAGAMLHADAAELLIGPLGYRARDQIDFGRELLEIATNIATRSPAREREMANLARFGGRWYAMNARLLLSHGHFGVARLMTIEGRIRYPESPDLFVVLGLLTEWRAGLGWDAGDLRGYMVRGELFDREFGAGMPPRGNAARDLEIAAADYRRAIALDPSHAGARLRLAWVHLLADDSRVWDDVSLDFISGASREAQFLAYLLRGTAAERRSQPSTALAAYEAARGVVPGSQTACVAVSSAQALIGRLDAARGTAAECLRQGAAAAAVDAWTLFRMGLIDATTAAELRAEAQRP
jgi:hypothetical protein